MELRDERDELQR